MKAAFKVIGEAFKDTWSDLWTVLVCNLVWLISQVFIVPGPPATLALFYYANRLANGETADLSDFWQAFKRYWSVAWRWGLLNYTLLAVLTGDFVLMGSLRQKSLGQLVQGLYLVILAAWLLVQLFVLPFLFEQETPGVKQALRNGAVMLGKNITFSLTLGVFLAVLLVGGIFVFMLSFAFGGMLTASAANHAVLDRLRISATQHEMMTKHEKPQI